MVGGRAIERVFGFWLLTSLIAVGLQAQEEIFFDDFETGDSCFWSSSFTPDFCDGQDNDCDLITDEDTACDDGLACTQDSCGATACEFLIDSGSCVIDEQCLDSGVANPLSSCEICDPFESQTEWTGVSDGTPCGDLECEECNSGVCVNSANGSQGPGCADITTDECDNPDTCEFGTCQNNYLAPGTVCGGALIEPICNPDTCNGNGLCTDVAPVSDGTACGDLVCDECNTGVCVNSVNGFPGPGCTDNTTDECNNPDTCDFGSCQENNEVLGTACGGALTEPICNPDTCDGNGICTDISPVSDGTACGGLVCEECSVGVCGSVSTCGDGVVCDASEICDDGNTDACGTCNATCNGAGSGATCSSGTGCVSGLDCLSGVCTGGLCE